jgi:hypothetical protein
VFVAPTWKGDGEPSEENPIVETTGTGKLSVLFQGVEPARVVHVADIDMTCHGAWCGARFDVDAQGGLVRDTKADVPTLEDFGSPAPRWGAHRPAKTIATAGVLVDAQRAYFGYSLYHLVEVDAASYAVVRQDWLSGSEEPQGEPETVTRFSR